MGSCIGSCAGSVCGSLTACCCTNMFKSRPIHNTADAKRVWILTTVSVFLFVWLWQGISRTLQSWTFFSMWKGRKWQQIEV